MDGDPATGERGGSDIVTQLLKRMDLLEANSRAVTTENFALRQKVEKLEGNLASLQDQMEDMRMKMAVVRERQLENAPQRGFGIVELLERILLHCPPKQLFQLRNVSHRFRSAVENLPKIQSITFSNPKDVVSLGDRLPPRRRLQPPLKLNPFFFERWKSPSPDCSAITFELSATSLFNPTYWIRPDLSATLSLRMGSPQQTQGAIDKLDAPIGRTYLTLPGLPTSVRATFTDSSKTRERAEYSRAWPAFLLSDVNAIVEVAPTTLVNMMKIAQILERSHAAGEREWIQQEGGVGWIPKSATDEQRELLRVVQHQPSYSQ